MTECRVPLYLNLVEDGPQRSMMRALHAATMLTLNPAGFRSAPKHRTLKTGQLTYVEQCAVEAGLTTRKELFSPNATDETPRRRRPMALPQQRQRPRAERRNMMFGRKAKGNTTPEERRERLATASVALGIELMGKAQRKMAAQKLASEVNAS